LLGNIPRLEGIARAMLYQRKNFDGSGPPSDDVKGDDIPLIARVLRVATDYVTRFGNANLAEKAYNSMIEETGKYDLRILELLSEVVASESTRFVEIRVEELRCGAVLASDLLLSSGTVLLAKGKEITAPMMERIRRIAADSALREPVKIFVSRL
jgi:hypothetical protein